MKKLMLALMVVSSLVYADCNDPKNADKVLGMLKSHDKHAVQVNYSKDKIDCAATCVENIKVAAAAASYKLEVESNLEPEEHSLCRYARPGHND